MKSIASKSSGKRPTVPADHSASTFEEPKIEDNYTGLYTSYNTGSVMENNVQPMTDGEDIQAITHNCFLFLNKIISLRFDPIQHFARL